MSLHIHHVAGTGDPPIRIRVIWRNDRLMAFVGAWNAVDITDQVAGIIREHGVEFEWLENGCVIARGERPAPEWEPAA